MKTTNVLCYQVPIPLLWLLTVGGLKGRPSNTDFNHELHLYILLELSYMN